MRTAAAFVLGLLVGAVAICAGLWATGNLQKFGPGLTVAFGRPAISAPAATLPDVNSVAPLPPAQVPPPEGDADRVIAPPAAASIGTVPPASLHLGLPLQGIDVTKIPDTFNDARNGHTHEALDMMAPRGTPVMAVAEGNVMKLFNSKQGGLTVYQFDNNSEYCYYYAHLDHYAPGLKEGTLLRKGDVLGYVGSTGDAQADAPHLHLAVFRLGPEKKWWEGTPLNPLPLLR